MGIARAMATLRDGELLLLTTRDAGAPIDIPAWCRLSGHSLISASHPNYIICKQGD
jgi:tRNA 2-thiouridine synthesizing protein A